MKIKYGNKGDKFDIVTDIIHIRKGLEVINAGHYNDLGLYNPKVLLEKAIELERKLIGTWYTPTKPTQSMILPKNWKLKGRISIS